MRPNATVTTAALLALAAAGAAGAATPLPDLDVLVGGQPRPEYAARGATYVEALRGREYTLRLTNPLPVRVAVALSVDGLNTVDARRSDVGGAAKWVLDPYETVEISGWQVSGSEARAFFFTGERGSYGEMLGKTENLGVIEAVFFRERQRVVPVLDPRRQREETRNELSAPAAAAKAGAACESAAAEDYAATGIGERREHRVVEVRLELEPGPVASVRLRYEFRPQLERLGVLPRAPRRSPLDRREGAEGFERRYCPEPDASPGR
jgi:hypothetical protein